MRVCWVSQTLSVLLLRAMGFEMGVAVIFAQVSVLLVVALE